MKRISLTFFCLVFTHSFVWGAAMVYYVNEEGHLFGFPRIEANEPTAAVAALASPPAAAEAGQTLTSGVLPGTKVRSLHNEGAAVVVDFSQEIIGDGLDEARLATIFDQLRATLAQFGIDGSIRMQAEGRLLSGYLPPTQPVLPRPEMQLIQPAAVGALAGKKISLSPGHGRVWTGSSWVYERPVYCAPLNREDDHNLENNIYLDTYLTQDGAVTKNYRCLNKNYGTHSSGVAWWRMSGSYWLKETGYPCAVYASSTGDCNLGTGGTESSDSIRSRPLASDHDNTDIHVALHSNGLAGDCTGTGCPNGTCTYYDAASEHPAWVAASQNLAGKVNSAIVNAIRTRYTDAAWQDRGALNSDGGFAETRIPNRPSILIELAFHDTCDRDGLYLQDNFFRSTCMWGVYKGICDYFGVTPTWGYYSYEVVSDDIPATMATGSVATVHITLRNRGVLWNDARQFRLGAVGDSDPFGATTRYNVGSEIDPGETKTFTLTLIAPETTGIYTTDWRMLREGVTWFGPTVSRNILVGDIVDNDPPSVPTNVVATVVAYNQIDLRWKPSTDNIGMSSYRVFRNSVLLGTATGTNYSDTTCASKTTYSYQVSAIDSVGNESAKSSVVLATTPPVLDFIMDNTQGTLTGSWVTGTSSTDKYLVDYQYKSTQPTDTGTFRWTPNIEAPGHYNVFVWYPQGSNRSAKSPYTVVYANGSVKVEVNQKAGGGQWNLIAATRPLLPGTAGYVELANGTGETSLNVMADAVRFTYASPLPPPYIFHSTSGGTLMLSWTNTPCVLQQATALTGSPADWSDVPGATSPYVINTSGASQPARLFRLRY